MCGLITAREIPSLQHGYKSVGNTGCGVECYSRDFLALVLEYLAGGACQRDSVSAVGSEDIGACFLPSDASISLSTAVTSFSVISSASWSILW